MTPRSRAERDANTRLRSSPACTSRPHLRSGYRKSFVREGRAHQASFAVKERRGAWGLLTGWRDSVGPLESAPAQWSIVGWREEGRWRRRSSVRMRNRVAARETCLAGNFQSSVGVSGLCTIPDAECIDS